MCFISFLARPMLKRFAMLGCWVWLWCWPGLAHAQASVWGTGPEVQSLAQRLAQAHQLPAHWVLQQLAQARPRDDILPLMLPAKPSQRKNWARYQQRFVESKRIQAGVKFARQYRQTLQRASATYGVPVWLILGVLGVETLYGQHMGQVPVMDSLVTLSLAFPGEHPRAAERQAFFERELGVLLALAQANPKLLKTTGSYAGAMGWGQFMPSSLNNYAVDFNQDGRIDPIHSPVDAIGSIANYFKQHGWQTGMPTHFEIEVNSTPEQLDTLLLPDILPTFSPSRLAELGLRLPTEAQSLSGLLALVELENGEAPNTYVVGTENFYVVTRYNWSSYYAMAVIELGHVVQTTERRTRAKRHSE